MATAAPATPAAEPANLTPQNADEVGIEEALFGDTSAEADAIAARLSGEQPPAAAPAATPEPGEVGSAPASPDATPPVATPPPAAVEPTPGTPPAPAAPAPSATPPVAPQAPSEEALRNASLTAQVAALQAELDAARASPQPGQPAAAPESGQPSGQPAPLERFNLTLPQEVTAAIFSDDEATANAGLTRLVNDLGTIVFHSVAARAQAYTDARLQQLVSAAEQGQTESVRATAREQGQEQYYTAFPDHKNPLIEPIIRLKAQEMAAEFPALAWGPDYINALGARVNGYVASLTGNAPPAEPTPVVPPVGQVPPARPAAMIPVGSRAGATPGSESEGSDLIVETLNPF